MRQQIPEYWHICPDCGLPIGVDALEVCNCPEYEIWECEDCTIRCSVRIPKALGLCSVGDLLHFPDSDPPFTCWNPKEVDPNDGR